MNLKRYTMPNGSVWPDGLYDDNDDINEEEPTALEWDLRYGISSLPLNAYAQSIIYNAASVCSAYEQLIRGDNDEYAVECLLALRKAARKAAR